jgi:hypothetical protein
MEKKWDRKSSWQKQILKKKKARKDILVNGSREGMKKIADNDNIHLLEVKRIFIQF